MTSNFQKRRKYTWKKIHSYRIFIILETKNLLSFVNNIHYLWFHDVWIWFDIKTKYFFAPKSR